MKPDLYLDGKKLDLAKRIGKGGEGEVYLLAKLQKAVKFYTVKADGGREAKVRAMVRQGLAEKFTLASFPEQIVEDRSGKFAGFTMRLFEGYRQIHDLYGVKSRKISFPEADYRFLVRAAANSARAVAQVHSSNCVIGDVNHSGILVSDDATVALIDSDSFQFDFAGKVHPCLVGVPEFTPPELQGKSLGSVIRTREHDSFGLAIAIFQLLFMGRHPYAGRQVSGGDLTLDQLIAQNLFAYARTSRNGSSPPAGVATLNDMPEDIASAFERAFGVDPSKRPSAVEWANLLQALERRLSRCSVNSMHFYPSSAAGCTWCKMEAASPGAVLFLPTSAQPSTAGVHSGAFDVERAWATIKAVVIPDGRHLLPKQFKPPADASQEARSAKSEPWLGRAFGVAVIFGALGLFAVYPNGSLFWFAMFGFGFFQMIRSSIDEGAWTKKYKDVDERCVEAIEQWRERIGIRSLESLRADIEKAVEDFRGLDREKSHALQRLQSERQSRQLHEYLDRFLIKNAAINGVGPSRTMALASYGIESAADVRRDRVLNVPGFGPATTDNLIAWRTGIEKRFVYNPSSLPADAQARAQVESQFAVRRNELIKRISEGHRELTQVSASVQQRMQVPEPNIATLAERRAQLQVDLNFLGIPQPAPYTLPARATFNPPRNSPTARPSVSTPPSTPSPGNAGVSCPICRSAMVRRVARQGRRRGQHFWGCSQYPSCTGTRN